MDQTSSKLAAAPHHDGQRDLQALRLLVPLRLSLAAGTLSLFTHARPLVRLFVTV